VKTIFTVSCSSSTLTRSSSPSTSLIIEQTDREGREHEWNRFKKGEDPRQIWKREKKLKSTACVFFLVCRSPSVQKGRGEEAVTDPPCFHGGAWVHAPPMVVRVEETRRHIPDAQKSSSHRSCSCRGPSLQFL
jgi:hypothetical protein